MKMSLKKPRMIASALILTVILAVGLSADGGTVVLTPEWINVFSDYTLLNGEPIPVGAKIDAYDPDGIHCGTFVVHTPGHYGFMPIYRDDNRTDEDDGANSGDLITLVINGVSTTQVLGDPIYWTEMGDTATADLTATQEIGIGIDVPPAQQASPGDVIEYTFTITNEGDGLDFFYIDIESTEDWPFTIMSETTTDYVEPGSSVDFTVELNVPYGLSQTITDYLNIEVTSNMDGDVVETDKTFTTVIVTSVDEENGSTLPGAFALGQNYPNPFNPETMIHYSLEKSGHVRLEVYNILGQSSAVLVDNHQDAGDYSVVFNAESNGVSMPSGVYFYRLTVNENTLTRKMILMK
ncbi:MAG: T9SS type A sorting domain-containing protein [candidate division Zixibacteria bacterium]|nr:T9SS type A sorting domain-containing protein [candidate division Zixibacteria bacterium]